VAAASLGQNRRNREPPLFSLFFQKNSGPAGKTAEFLASLETRWPNNSE